MVSGNRFGIHRVVSPQGVLPQPANKLDNTMEIWDNELLIDVDTLNIDAASLTQIHKQAGGDTTKMKEIMFRIVDERGKHHNPVTGSGGMLIGTVEQIGDKLTDRELREGDKIATLSSLTLTPLRIDRINWVDVDTCQVHVDGKAVLFESGLYAKMPEDMEDTLALAALDVAGAAAQTAKLVKPGDTVLIIGGGGKSGLLSLHEANKRAGVTGMVIALGRSDASCRRITETGLSDKVLQGDAVSDPLSVLEMVKTETEGELCDLVINTVDVPDTEMASILPVKNGGTVYFFSMATSFTKAALGAEGIGKDVNMIIGNGYTKGHADITLEILRENKILRRIFHELYTK